MDPEQTLAFSIASSISAIDGAVARVTAFAEAAGFDEAAVFAIDMASREGIANAVKHGNLLDERKTVEIRLSSSEGGLDIAVIDQGSGFSIEDVPDPTDPANLLRESGRGLLFIGNFMDESTWAPNPGGGTVLKMRKNR
jgi:serine/threonine-protein kinase RsbW